MDNDFNILDNFYSPYSIIRDIDINNKKIGEINTLVKQCLYPTIYSIIGKRYSGKTELSKVLNERMGIKLSLSTVHFLIDLMIRRLCGEMIGK